MLSRISVKKPFTVLVAVVLILVLGFVSLTGMTTDLLPSMNLPYAIVMTTYIGASPEEVETAVTKPIEQSMATISNIENISSISSENLSLAILEFNQTANMDSATIEMRESLDQIAAYWPDSVGSPVIMKLNPDMMPVMIAAVGADNLSGIEVTDLINDKIIPELESIEGVASVSSSGEIEESIQVIIHQSKIDDVNKKVKEALDKSFAEAEEEFEEGKEKLEDGKKELEENKRNIAEQMADAEKKIAQGQSEMVSGEIEIANQLKALEDAETQLNAGITQLTQLQTAVEQLENLQTAATMLAQAEEGLNLLESAQVEIDTQRAAIELMEDGPEKTMALMALAAGQKELDDQFMAFEATLNAQGMTIASLKAAITEMNTQLAASGMTVEEIPSKLAEIDQGLAEMGYTRSQIPQALQELYAQRALLAQGKEAINDAKAQLDAGKVTMADALAELSKNKTLASIELGSASAQLAAGEGELEKAETEIENAKESAYNQADVSNIITSAMVQGILQAQNFSMPAGYVTEEGIDFLVRVGDKIEDEEDLSELVLFDMSMDDMDPVKLSDVADVVVVDNTSEVYAKLNGNNGIMLTMQKQTDYSTGDVSDKIKDKFEQLQEEYDYVQIVTLMDQGIYIDLVVNSVVDNMLFGGALAIIILILFLKDLKPTFIIACSIPISILTAIVLMYFSGVTLNIISLSGLALGVGMLVDNSIVVIENIYRLRNEGMPPRKAAVEGAKEVGGAIFASTLTTVSVFLPIVFTTGITRQLFVDMGLTIAYSLAASLVVALTLVPAMASGMLKKTTEKEHKILDKVEALYGKVLPYVLKYKAVVLLATLILLVVSIVAIMSKGSSFMPDMESTQITVSVTAPEGSDLEYTAELSDQVIDRILEIEDVDSIGAMMGSSSLLSFGGSSGTEEVTMYVLLHEDKKISNNELKNEILARTEDLDCEVGVETSTMDLSALGGSGISIRIKGRELDQLQEIAEEVAAIVELVPGTAEVSDGMEETTGELRVSVDKEKAMEYSLTVAQVYQMLAEKISEASSATSIVIDDKDYDIFVLNNENEQLTRDDIRDMEITVTNQDGEEEDIKLSEIVSFEEADGLSSINRSAQSRYIDVSAELEDGYNVTLVSSDIQNELNKYSVPTGYTVEMTGEDQTINEAMGELVKMLALAVVFIYLIMVAQFQSLLSPFIIMFTIPLAFTGGFIGLLLTGNELSIIAMIGLVMLSGIIVNNGIVLVDYINQLRIRGMEKKEAIAEAGKTRLRPILMTALTTILGLSTMAMGLGMGGDMVQPMAIVTIGGLIYGTLLTLLVVPCIYDIFNRKKEMKEVDVENE